MRRITLGGSSRQHYRTLLPEQAGSLKYGFGFTAVTNCHRRPTAKQQTGCCHATAPNPEHHDMLSVIGIFKWDHRSFSVAIPSRPRTMAMIQNRTVTVLSFHPESSKWWCKGDILKMRFPVSLKLAT